MENTELNQHEITTETIQKLLEEKNFREIKRLLENTNPQDTAVFLEERP